MSVFATCVLSLGTISTALAATKSQSLGTSENAVDVWFLTCTNAVLGHQARVNVRDTGGVDGTRIYLHLGNTALSSTFHFTRKTTAPDGGTSSTVVSTDVGLFYLITVGRHVGSGTSETYSLKAWCTSTSGTTAPHTLTLLQSQ
jgi:hypothetical protein